MYFMQAIYRLYIMFRHMPVPRDTSVSRQIIIGCCESVGNCQTLSKDEPSQLVNSINFVLFSVLVSQSNQDLDLGFEYNLGGLGLAHPGLVVLDLADLDLGLECYLVGLDIVHLGLVVLDLGLDCNLGGLGLVHLGLVVLGLVVDLDIGLVVLDQSLAVLDWGLDLAVLD